MSPHGNASREPLGGIGDHLEAISMLLGGAGLKRTH